MSDQTTPSTGWQLDRSAPDAYEEYLVPAFFASWADRLVETAKVSEGDRVLDVGCGTGIVARRAAARVGSGGSVTGLDVNDAMLAVAADAAESQPPIEWRRGDATDVPFDDGRFDVVTCQQALQFVDDPVAAVGEMRRLLGSGGRAALSVWRPLEYQPAYVALADALERHVGGEAGQMMRSPFPSWDGADLRALVRDAGFDDPSVAVEIGSVRYPSVSEFVHREAASSPLAEPIAGVDREARDELVRAVAQRLDEYVDDDGVVSPMETYVVTAAV